MYPIPDLGTDTVSSEGILNQKYWIPTDSNFIVSTAFDNLVTPKKVIHKFLPKQQEMECFIKPINRKILRDVNLLGPLKELKAAYLTSPLFRDIYLYLLQNKVPLNRLATKRLHSNALNYMLLDGLLLGLLNLKARTSHKPLYTNFKGTYTTQ